MAQAAYNAVIKTAGISTVFSTTETFSNLSGTTYQIDDFTKSVWDRDVTPIVYLDGVVSTPTSVNYLFGKVTVSTAGTVTASGSYLPVTEKSGFTDYTMTMNTDVLDTTTFENNSGFRRRTTGLNDASISISGFRNPWFYEYTDTGANLESAIAISGGSSTTFTITAGSSAVAGDVIRIDDELFLVTDITAASTSQDTITATRAQWDTSYAVHSTDAGVYASNLTIHQRVAILVEIQPGGSSDDVWRAWTKVESHEHSGAIGDLNMNSMSLQLDSSTKAGTAIANNAD